MLMDVNLWNNGPIQEVVHLRKLKKIAIAIGTDDGETVQETTCRPFLYAKHVPTWLRERPIRSNCPASGKVQIGAIWRATAHAPAATSPSSP